MDSTELVLIALLFLLANSGTITTTQLLLLLALGSTTSLCLRKNTDGNATA